MLLAYVFLLNSQIKKDALLNEKHPNKISYYFIIYQ